VKPRKETDIGTEGFQGAQYASLAYNLNARMSAFFSQWYNPAIKFVDRSKERINLDRDGRQAYTEAYLANLKTRYPMSKLFQNDTMKQVNEILYFYYDTDATKSLLTRFDPTYDSGVEMQLTYFKGHTKNVYDNTKITDSNAWKDVYKYMRFLCPTGKCEYVSNNNVIIPITIKLITSDGRKIPINDTTYFDIAYDTESIIIYNKKKLYFSGYDWETNQRDTWTVQGSNDDTVYNLKTTDFISYVNNLKVESPSWTTMDRVSRVATITSGKSRPYSRVVMMRDIDNASKLIISAILEQYQLNYNKLTDDIRQQLLCGSSLPRDKIVINDPNISFKEVEIIHKKYVSDPNSCIKNMRKILIKTIVNDKTSLNSIYNTCAATYASNPDDGIWININYTYTNNGNINATIFDAIISEYNSAVAAEAAAAKGIFGVSAPSPSIAEAAIEFPTLIHTYTNINYAYRYIRAFLLQTRENIQLLNSGNLPDNITNNAFEPKTVSESTFPDILISKMKSYINNKLITYRDLVYYSQSVSTSVGSPSSSTAADASSSSTDSTSIVPKYKIPVPYFEYYPDAIKLRFTGSSPEIVSDYNKLWSSRSMDELITLNNKYVGYIAQIIEEKRLQEMRINTIYQMKLFEEIYKNVIAFAPDIVNYIDVPSNATRENELKNIVSKLRNKTDLENIRKKYEGYIYENNVADGYNIVDKSLVAALKIDIPKKIIAFKSLYETTYTVTKNGTPITVILNEYKLSSCVDPTITTDTQCISPNTFGNGTNVQTPGCGNCRCCNTATSTFYAAKDTAATATVVNDYNTFKTDTNNYASGNIGNFTIYLNTITTNKINKIPDNIEASVSRKAYDSTMAAFNSLATDYNKITTGIKLLGTPNNDDPTYASGYIGMAMRSIDADINSSVIKTIITKLKELNDVLVATNITVGETTTGVFNNIVNTPSSLLPANYDTVIYNAWMTTDNIYKLNASYYTAAKPFTGTIYTDDLTAINSDPTYVSSTAESKYFGTTGNTGNNCKTYIILTNANNLYVDILTKIKALKGETGEGTGITIDSTIFTITNYKTVANGNTIITYINQLKTGLATKISEYANEFIRGYNIEATGKATAIVKLKAMYSIYTNILENISKVYSTESTYTQPDFLQGRYIRIDRTAPAWSNETSSPSSPYIINLNGIQIFNENYEEITLTDTMISVRSTHGETGITSTDSSYKYRKKYLIDPIINEENVEKNAYEYMYASKGDSSTAYDWIEIDLGSSRKISKIVVKNRVNIFALTSDSTVGYVHNYRKRIKNLRLSIYRDVTRTPPSSTSGPLYAENGLVYSDSTIFNSRVQMYYTFNLFAGRANETTPIQLPPSVLSRMVKGRSFSITNELNKTPLNIYSIEIYDQFGKVYTNASTITVTTSTLDSTSGTGTTAERVFYEYGNELSNAEPSALITSLTNTSSSPYIKIDFGEDVYISRVVINHKPLTGTTTNTLAFSRVEIQDNLGKNLCNFSCKYPYATEPTATIYSGYKSMYGNMLTARLVLYTLDVPLKPNNSQSYCANLPYYNYTIMDGILTKTETTPVSDCTISDSPDSTNILTDIVTYYKDTAYWSAYNLSKINAEITKLNCKTVSAINAVLDYRNSFVSAINTYWDDMTSYMTGSTTATKYIISNQIAAEFNTAIDAFTEIPESSYITSLIDSNFLVVNSNVVSANTLIQKIKDEHVAMIKAMFKFRNAASNKFNFRYIETTVAADSNTNQLAKTDRVATINTSDSKYSMFNTMDWLIVGGGGSGAINQTSGGGGGGSGAFKSTQLGGFFGTKYATVPAYKIDRGPENDTTHNILYAPSLPGGGDHDSIPLPANTTFTITVGNGGSLTGQNKDTQSVIGVDGGSTIIAQGTTELATVAGGWGGGKGLSVSTLGARKHANQGGNNGQPGSSGFGGTGGISGISYTFIDDINSDTTTKNNTGGAGGGGGGVGFGSGGKGCDTSITIVKSTALPDTRTQSWGRFMLSNTQQGYPAGSGTEDSGAGGGGGGTVSAGSGGTGYAVVAFSTNAFEFPENLNKYLLPTKLEYYMRISPSNVISSDTATAAAIYNFIWRRLNIVPPLTSGISYTAGTTTYTDLGNAIISYCNTNPRTCFKDSERLTIIRPPAPSPTTSSPAPASGFQNQNPYNEVDVRKRIALQKLNAINLQLNTTPNVTRQLGTSVEAILNPIYTFFGLSK
jgi:hypothetical protein